MVDLVEFHENFEDIESSKFNVHQLANSVHHFGCDMWFGVERILRFVED